MSVFKDGDHALLQPSANRSPGRSHADGHMATILVTGLADALTCTSPFTTACGMTDGQLDSVFVSHPQVWPAIWDMLME